MGNQCITSKKSIRKDNLKKYQKDLYSKSPVLKTLKVVIATWLLDRSKLFDQLDKDNLSVNTFRISESCKLQKKPFEDAVIIKKNQSDLKQDDKKPVQLNLSFEEVQGGYKLTNNLGKQKQPWERVFDKWTSISVGGTFKIGSTSYTLNKLVKQKNYMQKQRQSQVINSLSHIGDEERQCRICYENHSIYDNPLISPCQCMGSVKYIHLKCLKAWLLSSQSKSQDYIHVELKKSKCQICHKSLLDSKAYKDIIGTLLSGQNEIPIPFAIFQGIHIDKANTAFKNFFIYSFKNKKTFSIGRGKKVQIRNQVDRSVSRTHTQVTFQNQQIMIRDLQSKFGTLKKIAFPVFIPFSQKAHKFQYGNTSISIFFERENTQDVSTDSQNQREDQHRQIRVQQNQRRGRVFDSMEIS